MKHRGAFVSVFLLVSLLSACAQQPSGPVEVVITLADFAVESSLTDFSRNTPYHFVVTNNGEVSHEIMLMPVVEAGQMSMEQMDEMALAMIEEDDLPPGATQTFDVTFTEAAPAGRLEFACHVPGHYEAGMKLPITVE